MKVLKKMLALVLASVLVASMLVGCSNEGGPSSTSKGDKVIKIRAWQSGMGIAWLESLIEGFEKKYPEYRVEYISSADVSGVMTTFGLKEQDETDLYFALAKEAKDLLPLDDMLDSKAEGESKTIREKFDSSYMSSVENPSDGKVYSLTYGGGVIGIAYNKKLFKEAGINTLPRTTNELVSVCDMLKRNDVIPWTHFKNGGYWSFLSDVFYMQYEGYDYYTNVFYANTDEQGNSPSLDVFTRKDGRYEVLKVYEQILPPEYVLSGSNSGDHISMQTRFVHGQAAMMVNGSWMANEMASVGSTDDFGLMKTPVISSIINKLTTVKKESQLVAVIDAVDAVTDGKKTIEDYRKGENYLIGDLEVSAKDWDYIMAARNTCASNFSGMGAFVPNYADQAEGAVEFLRYLYSDEGYQLFLKETGVQLPLSLDSSKEDTKDWSGFALEAMELKKSIQQYAVGIYSLGNSKIFSHGAGDLFAGRLYIQYLCAVNEQDRKSADDLWNEMINHINKNYESNWLKNME